MSGPELAESGTDEQDQVLAAMEAAVLAFVAAREARILLDTPGRLGANTVTRVRAISGARRASNKAQAKVEAAAKAMEEARDRWGALARGLAADRDVTPHDLSVLIGRAAAAMSLQDAVAVTRRALASALEAPDPEAARVAKLRAALRALEDAAPG